MTDPRPPAERARLEEIGATTPSPPPPRVIAWRHYLWIAGAALVVLLALHWLGPVLTPFLVGAVFAYLGRPLVDRLQRRRVPRSLGALVVILIFGIAVTALFLVLIPLVQAEVSTASRKLPDLFAAAMAQVTPWVEQHLGITLAFDAQSLRDYISNNTDDVRAVTLRVLSGVKTGGLIVLTLLINAALIPVVMFYLLRDWNLIFERVLELVPRRWDERTVVVARA
ncbi:MAG: AI-2E family transporter, partial [Casimicrobiaceae bacterium]